MNDLTPTASKLDELDKLIKGMKIAMMTTRRSDGMLVTRPMATQKREPHADLWFVTNIETLKVDEIENEPNVSLGYFDSGSYEWVSVSGKAKLVLDREKIRELYQPDWKMWFGDEGADRDGGPDDPRLALIFVDAESVNYSKAKHSKPRVLFEIARSRLTGKEPDIAREEHLSKTELG